MSEFKKFDEVLRRPAIDEQFAVDVATYFNLKKDDADVQTAIKHLTLPQPVVEQSKLTEPTPVAVMTFDESEAVSLAEDCSAFLSKDDET